MEEPEAGIPLDRIMDERLEEASRTAPLATKIRSPFIKLTAVSPFSS